MILISILRTPEPYILGNLCPVAPARHRLGHIKEDMHLCKSVDFHCKFQDPSHFCVGIELAVVVAFPVKGKDTLSYPAADLPDKVLRLSNRILAFCIVIHAKELSSRFSSAVQDISIGVYIPCPLRALDDCEVRGRHLREIDPGLITC